MSRRRDIGVCCGTANQISYRYEYSNTGSPRFVTLRDTMIRRHICYRNGLQCSTNSAMEETEHINHTTISPHSSCNGVSVLNRLKRTEHIPTGVNCILRYGSCQLTVRRTSRWDPRRQWREWRRQLEIKSIFWVNSIFVLSNSYEYEYEFIPWANYMVPMLLCVIPEDVDFMIQKWHTSYLLQWRHMDVTDVPNIRQLHCLFDRFVRWKSKKTSKLRVTGLYEGNSPVTGAFPS